MPKGFFYLVAIMDWASRRVLSWRLSNTMDATFCVEALEEALAIHGRPEIFNSDQGAQFTSTAFTGVLEAAGIRISMDGKGRCMDNVLVAAVLNWAEAWDCMVFRGHWAVVWRRPALSEGRPKWGRSGRR